MLNTAQRHATVTAALAQLQTEGHILIAGESSAVLLADRVCDAMERESNENEKARRELSRQIWGHTGAAISERQIEAYRKLSDFSGTVSDAAADLSVRRA